MYLKSLLKFRKMLSFRLAVWYAGIFTLSSFLAFFVFYSRIYTITITRVDEELIEETEELSATLSEDGIVQVKAQIDEEAQEENANDVFLRLISQDRGIIASSNMSSWGNIDINIAELNTQRRHTNYIIQTLSVPGRETKARIITAVIGPKEIIQIGMTLEEEEEYLGIFRKLFISLFLVLTLFSGLVGWFVARQGLRDVEKVTQTALDISNGSSEKRVKIKRDYEEIKRLGNAFNRMLDRIQTIHDAMREINDNIAHDLRSPLARIRGVAEMTLIGKKSDDDFKNMAVSTIEECDTLIDMINTMLEITETEAGIGELKSEKLDLSKLVSDACEIFRSMADDKLITMSICAPDEVICSGDKKRVQRIVTNILENAIKYTPEKGTINVSLLEYSEKIDIVIEDTGIGISQDELPHIFERFYRGEKSRTKGGVGLGLSLAKTFSASLGGTITAQSTLGKGSVFAVSFPR